VAETTYTPFADHKNTKQFPRSADERGSPWVRTDAMVAFVRGYYASKGTAAMSARDPPPAPALRLEPLTLLPGDSVAQREAEGLLVAAAGVALGVEFEPEALR
jgi:hypothetical protein